MSDDKKAKDERRSHERRRISFPIKIKLSSYSEFMEQYITDISAGGIFIATPTPYEPDDVVDIEFYVPDHDQYFFKVTGTIVRVHDSPTGMGIKFTEISEENQNVLDKLLQGESKN